MGKEKLENNNLKPDGQEAYIQELERRLFETENNLKALVSDQIDAVIAAGGTTPVLLFQAQQALNESKTQLEIRVAERTSELQQANERLEQELIERRRVEEALRESEGRFRAMADGTPVIIWVTDPEGRIEFINQAYRSFFGASLENIKTGGWQPLVHPEDREDYEGEFFFCLRAHQPFRAQARVQRYDGQWRWIDSHSQPRFSDSGEFLGMAGSSLDINDQKQAEADLKESEELFRVALANSPIVVFTCDRDLRYTWVYNLHPASPIQDVVGKRDDEFLDPEPARTLMAAKRAVIESGRTTRQEFCIPMNGVDYFFDATLEPLSDEKGNITGLTVAAMDVTQMRKLEAREIENRAQAEVQRLLMRHRELERLQISRDLHDGPLQGMIAINIALSQALQTEIEEEERLKKLTQAQQVILSGIHDLREICNDLRPPALAPLGLAKAIQSHLRSFQERFPEISFHSQLANDKQVLPSEVRNSLFRIYQELLLNACKHSQASGVQVGLHVGESEVTLEIEDDGIGFVKPASWLELGKAGHLGLIGVRERVDLINGRFEIESKLGAGTRVQVTVPLA